jgi:L-arabinonolactonase
MSISVSKRLWAIQGNGAWARWAPEYKRWDHYSEQRKFIFADPSTGEACYFVNPDGTVHWRNVDRNQNKKFPGIKAKSVAVGGSSRLWAIKDNGVWARWAPEYKRWDHYSEQRKFIFADPTTGQACYFVNPDGTVHWRNVDRNQNKTFPGIKAKEISVGGDNSLWAIQENGVWARWASKYNRWDIYSEHRGHIFADPSTGEACYFVNSDGSVQWRNVDKNQNKTFPGIKAKVSNATAPAQPAIIFGNKSSSFTKTFTAPAGKTYTSGTADIYVRGDLSHSTEYITTTIDGKEVGKISSGKDSSSWSLWKKNVDLTQYIKGKISFDIKGDPTAAVNYGPDDMSKYWELGFDFDLRSEVKAPTVVFGNKSSSFTKTFTAPAGKIYTSGKANIYVRGDLSSSSEYITTTIDGKEVGKISSGKDSSSWSLWKKNVDLTQYIKGKISFDIKGDPTVSVNYGPGGMSKYWELGFDFDFQIEDKKLIPSQSITARISLVEDYDLHMNKVHVYRTIITYPFEVTEVDIKAEKEIEVKIDDVKYKLNPAIAVKVPKNLLSKMVITVPCTNLGVPAIYIKTDKMEQGEKYIVCMDTPGYRKIEGLKKGIIAKSRNELNIKSKYKDADCHHAETAIRLLAQAHQSTYNHLEGSNTISRDRYVRPHNMDNLHWSYHKDHGFKALKPEEIDAATGNPTLKGATVSQWFGEDIFHAAKKATEIVVHTVAHTAEAAYKLGKNAVNTVENVATDAADTLYHVAEDEVKGAIKTGDDLLHGNISKIPGDVWDAQKSIVKDVLTGGENIAEDAVDGVGNALVITFKWAEEEVQYILSHTGQVGAAIQGILHQLEVEMEHFLAWVAEKLGWDDVLKIQDFVEKNINDSFDEIPKIISTVKTSLDGIISNANNSVQKTIASARKQVLNKQGTKIQINYFDKPKEQSDVIMSRVFTHESGDFSGFPSQDIPINAKNSFEKIVNTISKKFKDDNNLNEAISRLESDFSNLSSIPLAEVPDQIKLIALDLLEIAAESAIDLVGALLDVMLDLLNELFTWFKTLANTVIDLPFISALYAKLTHGKPLTLIGFSSLMIALPAKLIADTRNTKLATLLPSHGQSLSNTQTVFGFLYAGCVFFNGLCNALLDCKPVAPVRNNYLPIPGGNAPTPMTCLNKTLLYVDFAAQVFGNPAGDFSVVMPPKDATSQQLTAFAIVEGIWVYQWLLFAIDVAFAIEDRAENSDFGLYTQLGMEIIHLALFLEYNHEDSKTHEDGNWNSINWAFFMDPMEGIFQTGRTEAAMSATVGYSYPIVPIADFLLQSVYAGLYANGILDVNKMSDDTTQE